MAEFCKKCFVENLLDSNERELYEDGKLVIIETTDKDLCEGCGEYKPVVVSAYVN